MAHYGGKCLPPHFRGLDNTHPGRGFTHGRGGVWTGTALRGSPVPPSVWPGHRPGVQGGKAECGAGVCPW